jgi:hypothetical protein
LNPKPTDVNPEGVPPKSSRARRLAFQLTAVGLVVVSGLAGTGLARWLNKQPVQEKSSDETNTSKKLQLPKLICRDWPKPDLVLLLSAQQHGYLLPCGCSSPQYGGLERRYNLLQILKDKGWPVMAADLGDIPQILAPAKLQNLQGLLKYKYSMMSLKTMGYAAVGFGEYEATMSLDKILGEYALNEPSPRVVMANIVDPEKWYPGEMKPWEPVTKIPGTDVKVGVTALLAPTVSELAIKDKELQGRIGPSAPALKIVLAEMDKQKIDLPLLLYQGSSTRGKKDNPPEAVAVAKAFPQFPVILCLSETEDPSSEPLIIKQEGGKGQTLIVNVGHKGKNVGLVGVFRTGKADRPFEFRYQPVDLGEEYMTPAEEEANHPIVKLMERYTRELKDGKYLQMYGQRKHLLQAMAPVADLDKPGTPTYVGSAKCQACHKEAYKIWENSRHAGAYQKLVDAKRPANRVYDGECVVCHTTGFGYNGGFKDAEATAHLKNVGCESCHGPGSLHVANSTNAEWQERMNPWRAPDKESVEQKKKRMGRINDFCQSCHDGDNDSTWAHGGFDRKWPEVKHYTSGK